MKLLNYEFVNWKPSYVNCFWAIINKNLKTCYYLKGRLIAMSNHLSTGVHLAIWTIIEACSAGTSVTILVLVLLFKKKMFKYFVNQSFSLFLFFGELSMVLKNMNATHLLWKWNYKKTDKLCLIEEIQKVASVLWLMEGNLSLRRIAWWRDIWPNF